ncbi:hypothetical protein Ahy_A05g025460 [Arachis hypogaea]|uniref:Reverse transcriptase zinc-binding domain-containing protein n=1 Tax=Arachis hypogaea TaxID=3818 RepID=A0A445D8Q3_ARAHY|nr:hypothetical protein Ahy_A05g025460 [Arachis hypogaea]
MKLINQAGKETLIKAVVQAVPAYAMNIIKFPRVFWRKINSKIAKFWWTSAKKERALKNPNSILVQILKAIYFPDGNFWEARTKKGSSWVWKSLVHGRELIRKKGKWSVRDRSQISIWRDT